MKKIFSWLIISGIFLVVLYYAKKHPDEFEFIKTLSFADIAILFALALFESLLINFKTKIYMDYFSVRIHLFEWVGLDCVASLLNYLPIRGGMVSKALYLKNKHGFAYTGFMSFVGALNFISLFAIGVVGLACMSILYTRYSLGSIIVSGILLAIIAVTTVLFFVPLRIKKKNTTPRFLCIAADILDQWNKLKRSKTTVAKLLVTQFCIMFFYAFRMWFIFGLLGTPIGFFFSLIIVVFASLVTIVSITPASLGIKEATVGVTTKLLGTALSKGVTASFADRIISLLLAFVIGGIFSLRYLRIGKTGGQTGRRQALGNFLANQN